MIECFVESIRDVKEEIDILANEHWKEFCITKDVTKKKIDFDKYIALENSGMLICITMRDGMNLVGYCTAFVINHLHYMDSKFSLSDMIYISPDYRGHAIKMLNMLIKKSKSRGAEVLHVASRDNPRFEKMLGLKGFVELEKVHQRLL